MGFIPGQGMVAFRLHTNDKTIIYKNTLLMDVGLTSPPRIPGFIPGQGMVAFRLHTNDKTMMF